MVNQRWFYPHEIAKRQEISSKLENSSLLLLGAYRDNEENESFAVDSIIKESKLQGYDFEEIKLESLDCEAVKKLTASILGEREESTDNLSCYLFERSRGNPYFAIYILRELMESNLLVRNSQGKYEGMDVLEGLQVPESMLNVILKRIGKLDGTFREVLCKAAVIGREFEIEVLYNLTRLSYEELIDIIDNAVSMQFLEKSPGKRKLLFAHDRIRDVFYSMLDMTAKQKIHLETAKTVEELNRDNIEKVVFELAHHYIESGDPEKTLEHSMLSGDKAKQLYANEDAVRFYSIALELLNDKTLEKPSEWVRVTESLIEVYLLIGRADEAICLSEALLPMLGTPISKARVYKKTGIAYFKKGDWINCEVNISAGLKLLGERIPIKKTRVFVSLLAQLAVHLLSGLFPARIFKKSVLYDLERTKEIVEAYYTLNWMYGLTDISKLLRSAIRSLNLSEIKIGPSRELGSSLSLYAGLCMTVSLFDRGLRFHQKALQVRIGLGDKWGEAQTYQFVGYNQNWKGDYAKSIKAFEESIGIFREIGDLWEEGLSIVGLTGIYIYTSEYRKVLDNIRQYLEQSKKMNNIYGINVAKQSWARILIEMGAFDEAEELLQSTVVSTRENNIMILYCVALCYLGFLYMEKCQYGQAVENLIKAKECYLKNKFLPDPLLQLFPHLAEAYVKKLGEDFRKTGVKPSGKEIKRARLLCSDALKNTKRWISHYSTAIRAAAGFYALVGKAMKAERLFQRGIECSKKLGRRYEAAKGHFEYGIFLETAGRRREASANFKKAYEIFVEIGAKVYTHRCKAVLSADDDGIHAEDAVVEKIHAGEPTTRARLKYERRMNMVLDTGRYISSILDQDELLEKIMAGVIELVGAEKGMLLLYPENGEGLQAKVFHNVNKEKEWEDRSAVSRSIISKVERENSPLLISDALSEEYLKDRSSVILSAIKSVICVPIAVKGELLGVIYLDNNLINGLFNQDDLDIVSTLAGQAGVSIQNARMYSELKEYLEQIEKSKKEIAEWNKKLELRVEERTEALNKRNAELASAIEMLKEHAAMVEELAVTKERHRFAMDAHDHVGNTMTLLLKLLEDSRMTCLDTPEKMDVKLGEAIRITRSGLDKLRASVKGVASDKIKGSSLPGVFELLREDFRASGVNIELFIEDLQEIKDTDLGNAIYTLCVEACTNALKHGKAKNISIMVKKVFGGIQLVIFDDGCGCPAINKGFGLSGMEKRIEALNGNICFNSDDENGFIIRADIPCDMPYEEELQ